MKVHHSFAAVVVGALVALAPASPGHAADLCPPADTMVTDEGPVAVDYPASCERPTAPHTARSRSYRVKRGDTLWGVSKRFYGTGTEWRRIARASGLRGTLIHRGTLLTIPAKEV